MQTTISYKSGGKKIPTDLFMPPSTPNGAWVTTNRPGENYHHVTIHKFSVQD